MAHEHSGLLDANALFADLPHFMSPPSTVPPSATDPRHAATVLIFDPEAMRHRRRDEPTARSRRPAQPTQAHLIAVITCGSIALAAALAACVLYVSEPTLLTGRSLQAQTQGVR